MAVIPNENSSHITEVIRDELPDTARPDIRHRNRWFVATVDENYRQMLSDIADTLRSQGYHVSVVGHDLKVTKSDLNWPTAE